MDPASEEESLGGRFLLLLLSERLPTLPSIRPKGDIERDRLDATDDRRVLASSGGVLSWPESDVCLDPSLDTSSGGVEAVPVLRP